MEILSGRYELRGPLGSGAMGEVWRAYDLHLQREVAVKTIRGPVNPQLLQRFEREARAAARLSDHPHVVPVYDVGRQGTGLAETMYLVMELVRGRPLHEVAKDLPDTRTAVRWTLHIARALQAAHAFGIVHRDIKPANAMLVESGESPGRVKVTDFGIAALADEPRVRGPPVRRPHWPVLGQCAH
jgi:eukaryotic-like serine/threonine-protein kinase